MLHNLHNKLQLPESPDYAGDVMDMFRTLGQLRAAGHNARVSRIHGKIYCISSGGAA